MALALPAFEPTALTLLRARSTRLGARVRIFEIMRAGIALAILVGTSWAAWASDFGPTIVIPGRPGVPIMINGVDASYAVVEGDWGLGKGIHVQPTIFGGRAVDPEPHVGHYYPSSGKIPGYGRVEIEPAGKAKPAEAFHRSWSANSNSAQPPEPQVPLYPPPIITAPPNLDGGFQNFADPPHGFKGQKQGKSRP